MTINYLLPAVRPQYVDVMRTWQLEDHDYQFYLSLDTKYPWLEDLLPDDVRSNCAVVQQHTIPDGNVVKVWNQLASQATGDLLCIIADDYYNETPEWPNLLEKPLDEAWAFFGDDGIQSGNMATHPAVTRPYYELFGYIFYPGYRGWVCDREFTEVGRALERLVYVEDWQIDHQHWVNHKSPKDQHYRTIQQHQTVGETVYAQADRKAQIIQQKQQQLTELGI